MKMPGCPIRDVKGVKVADEGVVLTLSCGHELWVGGHVALSYERARCQQGPCYSFQRPMGIHC